MSFKSGDIVDVQLPSGLHTRGMVLYVSAFFRDVIGVVFPPDGGSFEVQYTNIKAAEHYGWKVVDHRELGPDALAKTERIIGGEVFVGDEMVRSASNEDFKKLPRMLVKGMPVIFDELAQMNLRANQ